MGKPGTKIFVICLSKSLEFYAKSLLTRLALFLFLAIGLLAVVGIATADEKALLFEDFDSLESWKPLVFSGINKHSQYEIISLEAGGSCLRAESDASASAIVWNNSFSVIDYPRLSWKWKVEGIYKKGDATVKSGDDYPIRVYVLFEYEPSKAPFWKRAKYKAAKTVYGEYPPDSTLNYIWANKAGKGKILTSAYTDSAKMVVLQTGRSKVGRWVSEEVDILSDYRKAFGVEPPGRATIAIMSDSDNTGEKAVAYLDQLKLEK